MIANPDAFRIGQLCEQLFAGYFAHRAAMHIAKHPGAILLSPGIETGQIVPVGRVLKRDGTAHVFHFNHFLIEASQNAGILSELDRVWLTGSFLEIGNHLGQHQYFDHAPELELIYHIRNGIAHGNRFRIDNRKRLKQYPAHIRLINGNSGTSFEVTPDIHDTPVLFDFMEAGDLLDLLQFVGGYLSVRPRTS